MLANILQLKHFNRGLIAVLLALLLSLATYNSSGIIRGGDEDEGSGVGGTGRTFRALEPTGSGLGGTGFRPYLGYSDSSDGLNSEVTIVQHPLNVHVPVGQSFVDAVDDLDQISPQLIDPIDHSIVVMDSRQITHDSSPIAIEESIQWEIDSQIISLESSRQLVALNTLDSTIPNDPAPAMEESGTIKEIEETNDDGSHLDIADESESQPISWFTLARHLNSNADHSDKNRELASATADPESDIAERPERFQRPSLPPVQRIQPVHRTGLLPPRIRPLRL